MYKLILAEDDIFTLEQFVSAYNWESMGFSVVGAFPSSVECLDYLISNHADALITDIRMPVISGLELVEKCHELFPNLGIILTSAYSNFEYAHKAIKYNVIDYILKPIDKDDFIRAMAKLRNFLDKSSNPTVNNNKENLNPTIEKIYKYVSENFQNNISTADISACVMINPDYFGIYFKKHTGETFSAYLRRFRLTKAAEMLKNTDLKITAIAEQVGYKNLSHFYERFYEQYNTTPAEYRKK